jgi:hypothetical protein
VITVTFAMRPPSPAHARALEQPIGSLAVHGLQSRDLGHRRAEHLPTNFRQRF